MNAVRRIAVVTTSRADYGHLYWPLKTLQERPGVAVDLMVTAAHLSPEYGETVRAIEADGFEISARLECLLSSDSDVGMAKTIGLATLAFTEHLDRLRPDLLLLIADRYEMLAPASAAMALRIPMAHIEGGEISQGAIDDVVRNALTKMCHLHFVPTPTARRRVIAMGEEPWRVTWTGAPSLDHLRKRALYPREDLVRLTGFSFERPTFLVSVHPTTLASEPLADGLAVIDALENREEDILFCFPNADSGSKQLIQAAQSLCDRKQNAKLFVNLDHLHYWSLLKWVTAMIGNSSSGIMEAPAVKLPVLNVGDRQKGRERAANILDVPGDFKAILAGLEQLLAPQFKAGLEQMQQPYGDGHASEKIADVLCQVALGQSLLQKQALPLHPDACRFVMP